MPAKVRWTSITHASLIIAIADFWSSGILFLKIGGAENTCTLNLSAASNIWSGHFWHAARTNCAINLRLRAVFDTKTKTKDLHHEPNEFTLYLQPFLNTN